VKVEHADGFYTEYANLDDDVKVAANDKVSAGKFSEKSARPRFTRSRTRRTCILP
jgi:hypothetical protein